MTNTHDEHEVATEARFVIKAMAYLASRRCSVSVFHFKPW